ncbi:type II toxin-antitoxin system VapC family toxin [Caulobacter sp. 73W]|uniref:Ribonuclease VapC n=1 Tax=Caulobacter sp. 73W TaxID=3161137 RepID=A0AB39KXG9_9CAUL
MILLDTNVVSEAIRPEPSSAVGAWLDRQAPETLFVSSVTVAEMLFGVSALPDGRRKQMLRQAVLGIVDLFEDRILPFDTAAARSYADLTANARKVGRGFPTPDGYIAAIAAANGFAVATRDTGPFEAGGLEVIDPWTAT